jgi:Cytochrome domain of cellobiose dehydrogenase
VYPGPQVTVLSSNITANAFSAQLQLSNVTSWISGGQLNVNSDDAGVVWAFGTIPPDNPADPSSNFQQHKVMGVFSVNMKAAQASSTGDSPTGTSGAAPVITGDTLAGPVHLGLTKEDKVDSNCGVHLLTWCRL